MGTYIGEVIVSEKIGEPQSSIIEIIYTRKDDKKTEQASDLTDIIEARLVNEGKQVLGIKSRGMMRDGKIDYSDKATSENVELEAHENWHLQVYNSGYKYTNPDYYILGIDLLDESTASAVGDYEEYIPTGNKKAIEDYRKFSKKVIGLYERALEEKNNKGGISQGLVNEMEDIQKKGSFFKRQSSGINWASFLEHYKYQGLYEPSMEILETYGKEEGKKILLGAFGVGFKEKKENALDVAAKYLMDALPEKSRESVCTANHYEPVMDIEGPGSYLNEFSALDDIKVRVYTTKSYIIDLVEEEIKKFFENE
ncbi:MAG: hypothetical protein KAU95_03250 [Candidatus Aenigmarchaeota archaeon]|nr:hypothetical protein [Candidatus Aenigmarchaeota archaeon]